MKVCKLTAESNAHDRNNKNYKCIKVGVGGVIGAPGNDLRTKAFFFQIYYNFSLILHSSDYGNCHIFKIVKAKQKLSHILQGSSSKLHAFLC